MSKGPEAFRTISEVAEDLDLPQHVLRFWETRFTQIKPLKRGGGRRYYRPDDVDLLRGIRQLLYGEGYTIKGVQRILKEQGAKFVIGAAREEVDAGAAPPQPRLMMDADDQADEDAFAAAPEDYAEARDGEELETAQNGGVTPARTRRLVEQFMPNARSAGAGGSGLTGEDVRKLQGTLAELLECKRLLDQAR